MSNSIEISSEELKGLNPSSVPENAKELANCSFCHYTSLDTLNKILESKSIHIGNIASMNDLDEVELHSKDKHKVYSLCFCNSNTEKIPMWYLYAGIAGQGASLEFTPSTMLKLLESIETLETKETGRVLKKDTDFEFRYGWVYYRKKGNPTEVKYRNKWYTIEDSAGFVKENYFVKSYPWEYEREFRILIILHDTCNGERLVLKLPEKVQNNLKIKLAPEITPEKIKEMLPELKGISEYLMDKLNHSKLIINMKLCERNFNSFVSYIRENTDKEDSKIDYSRICEAIAQNCQKIIKE